MRVAESHGAGQRKCQLRAAILRWGVGFSKKGCRAARRHYFRPDCVDLLPASGSKKWKVAPAVALSVAQIRPPWASMIDFEIARPMPTPEGFVV